ncbi:MAG: PhnD/SsuA/transferrin family substrate-binding protein [Gammaproteobacteria bacterium]|nr:PhnD/SsuA/transferrin family substrate-binding protein [Gammaproteobacteria bacterium]
MSNQITLRIGGVPEHFNLPWHLTLPEWCQQNPQIVATWTNYPSGTGAMVAALLDDQLDIALLVTEGGVKATDAHAQLQLLGFYTRSALRWGIHVPPDGSISSIDQIRGKRYAISREGSGSQLMAMIHARQQGWDTQNMSFVIVNDLDGAANALGSGEADVFFWEHYTTKPRVQAGQFHWLVDFPPPWPGFVIAARSDLDASRLQQLQLLLDAVFRCAAGLQGNPAASELIASRYHMHTSDAADWLAQTQWASRLQLDAEIIARVREMLK